ncbi:DUF6880 family protein [Azospirillum griseum]|uniref:Uncharacterized protein n=1 Tax=Azospirillum griseum TaxID=2496639 RepID=A0A3S0HXN0_9PROT|nr:DUF6880 family protein [Azospirillum griseum]RTR16303.1 hypothetical protein EJ903_21185 [Azospirillum griseum]
MTFLLEWPSLERAAQLVIDRRADWDGRHHDVLGPAAATLEERFPLAATVPYRAVINDILKRGKSPAYGQAARYLAVLEALSGLLPTDAPIESHQDCHAALKASHGRKLGIWSLVAPTKRT